MSKRGNVALGVRSLYRYIVKWNMYAGNQHKISNPIGRGYCVWVTQDKSLRNFNTIVEVHIYE